MSEVQNKSRLSPRRPAIRIGGQWDEVAFSSQDVGAVREPQLDVEGTGRLGFAVHRGEYGTVPLSARYGWDSGTVTSLDAQTAPACFDDSSRIPAILPAA